MQVKNRDVPANQASSVESKPLPPTIGVLPDQADEAEELAGYGRWSLALTAPVLRLSVVAARYLGLESGLHASPSACCKHVVADDLPALLHALAQDAAQIDCQFRVIDPLKGVRWLHMRSMRPSTPGVASGLLLDITFAKHAALREKFNFALTQSLISTNVLGEAVSHVIELVCKDLGWEWGAYWAPRQNNAGVDVLACKYSWHDAHTRLGPFKRKSEALTMAAGEGLVGRVWGSGQAQWLDDIGGDQAFLRRELAAEFGLKSGYMFPVTYVTPEGVLQRPGVLEFFSNLPRQHEAQLPELAASISALIAQTAQRMVQQERIRRLAQTDEMTDLANRNHFHALLDLACRDTPVTESFGVLYIDLDQFKPINDAFGHEAGNVVLSQFSQRLQLLAPPACAIGRLGGDEFAILCTPDMARHEIDALAERVLQAARSRFFYKSHELSVSASIGISLFPAHGVNTAQLLHAADAAMYLSKHDGRNLASHFSADNNRQQTELAARLMLLSELHQAYLRQEFFLEYQPIFEGSSERVTAVEALIRWRKPNGEIVAPNLFIPLAEQSGLIVHLGRWVMEQVCRDLPQMQAAGMTQVQVHINMAAPEFINSELPRELMAIVSAANVQPANLCLELTEGVVMSRMEKSIPVMHELQRLGFAISLDDFGMGYSSLSMLKKLPVSSLKIDRLFTAGVPHDRDDCAIVRAILELGRSMKLRVIAEGVETDAQLGYLRQFGCCLIQGYLLAHPMPLATLIARHGRAELRTTAASHRG